MITIGSKIVLKKEYWKSYPVLHQKEPYVVVEVTEDEYRVDSGYWISKRLMEDLFLTNLEKVLK